MQFKLVHLIVLVLCLSVAFSVFSICTRSPPELIIGDGFSGEQATVLGPFTFKAKGMPTIVIGMHKSDYVSIEKCVPFAVVFEHFDKTKFELESQVRYHQDIDLVTDLIFREGDNSVAMAHNLTVYKDYGFDEEYEEGFIARTNSSDRQHFNLEEGRVFLVLNDGRALTVKQLDRTVNDLVGIDFGKQDLAIKNVYSWWGKRTH